jgi:DNA-binding transcriptional LysR family regulator
MAVGFGESVVLPLIAKFISLYPNIDVVLELTEREELSATYAIYLKREMISPKTRAFLDLLVENIVT